MTPTRELAKQVAADFQCLSAKLLVVCVYGGTPYGPQGNWHLVARQPVHSAVTFSSCLIVQRISDYSYTDISSGSNRRSWWND